MLRKSEILDFVQISHVFWLRLNVRKQTNFRVVIESATAAPFRHFVGSLNNIDRVIAASCVLERLR